MSHQSTTRVSVADERDDARDDRHQTFGSGSAGQAGDMAVRNPAPDASPSRTPTGTYREVKLCR